MSKEVPVGKGGAARWGHRPQPSAEDRAGAGGRVDKYGQNAPISLDYKIANHFCEWVGGRLPTALEWEYAARGPKSLFYPWGNEWDPQRGNFSRSCDRSTRPDHLKGFFITPIDGYPDGVSPFGIWDMIGNLAEWIIHARYKGQTLQEAHNPAWFYFMPVFINLPGPLPGYIGFRPVKDEWEPEVWPGHDFSKKQD